MRCICGHPRAWHRTTELVRLVRQDCGSCHGLRLTGVRIVSAVRCAPPANVPTTVEPTLTLSLIGAAA